MIKRTDVKLWIFIVLTSLTTLILLISMLFSSNLVERFYFIELKADIFGDYRNVLNVLYNYPNPYDTGIKSIDMSYPPFALLLYIPFLIFFIFSFISEAAPYYISLVFFLLIPLVSLVFLYRKTTKGKNSFFLLSLFFVFPFIFLIHRANILLYCYMFLMFFLVYYKSENKNYRNLSLLALAAASAIKIYPLIFLILLFTEGRFADIFKTILLSLLLFFIPFLFFRGGFDNIKLFLQNMFYFSDNIVNYGKIKLDNYSMVTLLQFASLFINGSINATGVASMNIIMTTLLLLTLALSCLIIKTRWKIYAVLAICITAVPVISYIYTQVFFIPAFIAFLKTENKTKKDILYFILFLFILIPINRFIFHYDNPPLNWPIDFPWYYNNPSVSFLNDYEPFESILNTLIAVLVMLLMYLTILAEVIIVFVKSIKNKGFLKTLLNMLPSKQKENDTV